MPKPLPLDSRSAALDLHTLTDRNGAELPFVPARVGLGGWLSAIPSLNPWKKGGYRKLGGAGG
jgi:hypothetical protein